MKWKLWKSVGWHSLVGGIVIWRNGGAKMFVTKPVTVPFSQWSCNLLILINLLERRSAKLDEGVDATVAKTRLSTRKDFRPTMKLLKKRQRHSAWRKVSQVTNFLLSTITHLSYSLYRQNPRRIRSIVWWHFGWVLFYRNYHSAVWRVAHSWEWFLQQRVRWLIPASPCWLHRALAPATGLVESSRAWSDTDQ